MTAARPSRFRSRSIRLGLDRDQRDFLRQGLAAGALPPPPVMKPGIGLPVSHAAAERAAAAGLVTCGGWHVAHWQWSRNSALGYLSGASDPIAFVRPGDIVSIDTVSHGCSPIKARPEEFFARYGIPSGQVLADAATIYAKVQHSGLGPHIVSAPVHVEGAQPGDVLAYISSTRSRARPTAINTMQAHKGGLPDEFTLNRSTVIPFDLERGRALFAPGIEVPLKPFFGIMATGPARSLGRVSSVPPGAHGGNIDLKELTAGSTLYLPVHVPGALFMVGDGHAAQGNGEVDLTAIETSMTGTFRLELIKDARSPGRAQDADPLGRDGSA